MWQTDHDQTGRKGEPPAKRARERSTSYSTSTNVLCPIPILSIPATFHSVNYHNPKFSFMPSACHIHTFTRPTFPSTTTSSYTQPRLSQLQRFISRIPNVSYLTYHSLLPQIITSWAFGSTSQTLVISTIIPSLNSYTFRSWLHHVHPQHSVAPRPHHTTIQHTGQWVTYLVNMIKFNIVNVRANLQIQPL